jgi:hypothetical protein
VGGQAATKGNTGQERDSSSAYLYKGQSELFDRISHYLGRTITMHDHSQEHSFHFFVICVFASKYKRKRDVC